MKDELAKLLASNQVVLVHGETGSGKTTQIGQFILDGPSDRPPRVVLALDVLFSFFLCVCVRAFLHIHNMPAYIGT